MIVKPSKEFLREALTNNSFDIDSTDKALRITLDHSFSYLYRLQRNMVCYEEYFYTTRNNIESPDFGDYYMDPRERICINLPATLILQQYREKFRTSKYYKTKVDYSELKSDHSLFARLPIILIDNHVLRDFSMEIFDDYFTAHLPFDRYFLHTKKYDNERKEYEFIDHTTSLQVINNAFFTDVETNTGMLRRNSYSGNFYDRIYLYYLKDLGVEFPKNQEGMYFVSIFFGDAKLGSQLQEVEFDENGDVNILYDADLIKSLLEYTGTVTIRFYFYRNLKKYKPFHHIENNPVSGLISVREKSGSLVSDIFMIQNGENQLYSLPIPTENLLIFKYSGNRGGLSEIGEGTHYPNTNVHINYPNIYKINQNLTLDDKFSIYYFYIPPYELEYHYMYQFYYSYLKYRWTSYRLEEIVNRIYFGDVYNENNVLEDFVNASLGVKCNELKTNNILPEEYLGTFYEYAKNLMISEKMEIDEIVEKFLSDVVDVGLDDNDLPLEVPTDVIGFGEIFDFIINHEIVGYFYDETDFIKNYKDEIHPFEYKVNKLKEFISDDVDALHNYVLAQNKVGIKYEFLASDANLEARYRTTTESGKELIEPMYLFPIEKPEPSLHLSCRVFIDGLLCGTFFYERYELTDMLYIPVNMVNSNSYFEVEIFPSYTEKHVFTFDIEHPSVILEFPSGQKITPTLSDIFYFEGIENTVDRLDPKKFQLEYISDKYNYYTDITSPVDVYFRVIKGDINRELYYLSDGTCYSLDGFRLEEYDISVSKLEEMLIAKELVKKEGYITDNSLDIVPATDTVPYEDVAEGESTLTPDDKGVLYSNISKIRITCKDITLYGKPITIAIAKESEFEASKMTTVSYPSYVIPIENSQNVEEYTRAFKNGRLLSKNRYDFTSFDGLLGIQILEKLVKNETIVFDISPYRNRLIFYKEELDSDLVSLNGYINKPFDMRYYEVYLNGRRLNKTNVYPISPWEFKLAGTHSIYNLEIYEKDRDWEYYGTDFGKYLTLSDFIRNEFVDDDIKDLLIHDVTGDIPGNDNTEERMPWDRIMDLVSVYYEMFYYMKLVPIHFVSGDKLDFISEEIKTRYPIIYQLYHNTNDLNEDVLFLNPDKAYESENTVPDESEEEPWSVYLLGNTTLENLDDM